METIDATASEADIYTEYPAQTYARNMVDVRGRVEGYIEKWLFRPGQDFLVARDGEEMAAHLRAVLSDAETARRLAASGLETIRARHTCAHRVSELLAIIGDVVAIGGEAA